MKRLVLWGLLSAGVLTNAACIKDEPSQVDAGTDPVACPVVQGVGTSAQALRARDAEDGDGREQVLVRFKPGTGGDRRDVEKLGGKVKRAFSDLRLVAARLTPAQREALAKDPRVESIGPDRKVYALGLNVLPSTYLLQAEPTLNGSPGEETRGLKMIQADKVWDANGDGILDTGAPTGRNIKVCILDTGLDRRHPELLNRYLGGRDFVDTLADGGVDLDPSDETNGVFGTGHGTHVAGTIAAQFANGAKVNPRDPTLDPNGVIGVAPGVDLLIGRVLGTNGSGDTSGVIDAVRWCTEQKANIITLSLGANDPATGEKEVFDAALDAGILSIAATGNDGTEVDIGYPAAYGSVIGVGAVQTDGGIAGFSQRFPSETDTRPAKAGSLVAPGTVVQSTFILGRGTAYTEEFTVNGQRYDGVGLEEGNLGAYTGRLVNCGIGDTATSCGEGATCDGFVAYMDRGGGIQFNVKAQNALAQGARAIIFGNNKPEDDADLGFTLSEPNPQWPPAVAVTTTAAAAIKTAFGSTVSLRIAGSDYAYSQGTSMAAPHVTGVAALVWSARPSLTPLQVRRLLQDSAKDLGPNGYDQAYGYGLVQAKDALDLLLSPASAPGTPAAR